ncbi:hypothetical protein JOQ06_026031 [Pogonophryne albipinna]|uniref:Uncharacterized protein n=1 Tax=Pogonophryne albipinna TaxID=1090488 RepID=A0AAD6F570_9TELE|nr:hypothetical protein JOQ06_026031 [Pogonophryne albipinna]
MAVNWPGLVSIGVFYIIVLGTGIWASRKSKREEKKCSGNRSEVAMVGGRNLNSLCQHLHNDSHLGGRWLYSGYC